MAVPSYDPMWIRCSEHWPQADLPVLWQPFDEGPSIPRQFVACMRDLTEPNPKTWRWRPTGIYRELAWENGYLKFPRLGQRVLST